MKLSNHKITKKDGIHIDLEIRFVTFSHRQSIIKNILIAIVNYINYCLLLLVIYRVSLGTAMSLIYKKMYIALFTIRERVKCT